MHIAKKWFLEDSLHITSRIPARADKRKRREEQLEKCGGGLNAEYKAFQ
jgi:hypothetical protein